MLCECESVCFVSGKAFHLLGLAVFVGSGPDVHFRAGGFLVMAAPSSKKEEGGDDSDSDDNSFLLDGDSSGGETTASESTSTRRKSCPICLSSVLPFARVM